MKLKFKNRIAFFNTLAAATSTLIVFVAVYFVVFLTAYKHLDDDIRNEQEEVFKNIQIKDGHVSMRKSAEWDEKEHAEVEMNPTFIQITDRTGELVFLSANMKNKYLPFNPSLKKTLFFNNQFECKQIRQGQFPIFNQDGLAIAQLSVGISRAESALVLNNLFLTLLIAFPLLSLIFFWASSFAAAQGIAPIHRLIEAAREIDDQNIGTRLPLPPRHDEIYLLATTINELLLRIDTSFQREKQITADISHELRSPLAGIRGNLEVLLRKRREPEQYELKIEQVLHETDRMNKLLEQLLQLSRMETGNIKPNTEQIALRRFCTSLLEKWETLLAEHQLTVELTIPNETPILADSNLLEVILGNLLSNSLKYGSKGTTLSISWNEPTATIAFADRGQGIPPEHLPHIFDRFYRADVSRNTKIPGTGLGLSIAKKMADLQGIQLSVQSEEGRGTTFFMQFPFKL